MRQFETEDQREAMFAYARQRSDIMKELEISEGREATLVKDQGCHDGAVNGA